MKCFHVGFRINKNCKTKKNNDNVNIVRVIVVAILRKIIETISLSPLPKQKNIFKLSLKTKTKL